MDEDLTQSQTSSSLAGANVDQLEDENSKNEKWDCFKTLVRTGIFINFQCLTFSCEAEIYMLLMWSTKEECI
ncbi:unnamed protein product, partial [Sphagnum tenellum]